MIPESRQRIARIFRDFSDMRFEETPGGTPVCVFTAPGYQGVAYATGSFCVVSGKAPSIVHDAVSLERFLRYNSLSQDLCPADYGRWERALVSLKAASCPQKSIVA